MKTMFGIGVKDTEFLEGVIDRTSLYSVVNAIQEICFLKANHIEENWQDPILARKWNGAGLALNSFLDKIDKQGL